MKTGQPFYLELTDRGTIRAILPRGEELPELIRRFIKEHRDILLSYFSLQRSKPEKEQPAVIFTEATVESPSIPEWSEGIFPIFIKIYPHRIEEYCRAGLTRKEAEQRAFKDLSLDFINWKNGKTIY